MKDVKYVEYRFNFYEDYLALTLLENEEGSFTFSLQGKGFESTIEKKGKKVELDFLQKTGSRSSWETTNTSDVYKAMVAFLGMLDNTQFISVASMLCKLIETSLPSPKADEVLKETLREKISLIREVREKLEKLGIKQGILPVDPASFSIEEVEKALMRGDRNSLVEAVKNTVALIESTKALYRKIVQGFEIRANAYNADAARASVLSQGSRLLEDDLPLKGDIEAAGVTLPVGSQFPHMKPSIWGVNSCEKRLDLSDVTELEKKFNELERKEASCAPFLQKSVGVFGHLRDFFTSLYKRIINAISKADKSLADDFEKAVDGKKVSETRTLVHQYSSSPFPMLEVINARKLSDETKVKIINILAKQHPTKINGGCPVNEAIKQQASLKVIMALVEAGASIDGVNSSRFGYGHKGTTALHVAAREGYLDVCRYLVSKGAKVDARTEHGETPLHQAVDEYKIETAAFLLQSGANINAKEHRGLTPLQFIYKYGYREEGKQAMVEFLISSGADRDLAIEVDRDDGLRYEQQRSPLPIPIKSSDTKSLSQASASRFHKQPPVKDNESKKLAAGHHKVKALKMD